MSLQPYQQRVVEEKADLDERLSKLRAFISHPDFFEHMTDEDKRVRLVRQEQALKMYSNILCKKIYAF